MTPQHKEREKSVRAMQRGSRVGRTSVMHRKHTLARTAGSHRMRQHWERRSKQSACTPTRAPRLSSARRPTPATVKSTPATILFVS